MRTERKIEESFADNCWRFINNRIDHKDFEAYLYEHFDEIKSFISDEDFEKVMMFNYKQAGEAELKQLRNDLIEIIRTYKTSCPCVKFESYHMPMRRLSFPYLDNTYELMQYFENIFSSDYVLEKNKIDHLAGYWHSILNRAQSCLQDAEIYRCKTCNKYWLVLLDETEVEYHLIELSQNEAYDIINHDKWPERSKNWPEGYDGHIKHIEIASNLWPTIRQCFWNIFRR